MIRRASILLIALFSSAAAAQPFIEVGVGAAIGARDANEFPDTLGEIDGVNLSGSNYLWARSIPAVSGVRVGRFIAQYEVI